MRMPGFNASAGLVCTDAARITQHNRATGQTSNRGLEPEDNIIPAVYFPGVGLLGKHLEAYELALPFGYDPTGSYTGPGYSNQPCQGSTCPKCHGPSPPYPPQPGCYRATCSFNGAAYSWGWTPC
jgi:hypothetical protein